MQFTNKLNLPEPIAKAIENREYSKGQADVSVTSLLNPPQLHRLMKSYGKDIVVDVADSIWALFGTAVHHILSMSKVDGIISEERYFMKIGDWTLSGQTDIYKFDTKAVSDYKVTSIYKIQKADFDDWTFQLNAYKLLLEAHGHEVNSLQIVAIIRDWSHAEARNPKNVDYPKSQVQVIDIPMLAPIDTTIDIAQRIKAFQATEGLTREQLPECTAKERWAQEDAWLVYSKEKNFTYRKFPIKVTPEVPDKEVANMLAKAQAESVIAGMKAGGYEPVFESGFSLRCEYFCPVSKFCYQYSKSKPEAIVGTTAITTDEVVQALKDAMPPVSLGGVGNGGA